MNISSYLWPGRTHFGRNAVSLVTEETIAFQKKRPFLVTDPGVVKAGLVEPVLDSFATSGLSVVLYESVEPDPTLESIDKAGIEYRESGADIIVGLGGGSVLDAAKALRLLVGGPEDAIIGEYLLVLGDEARPAPSHQTMPPMIAIPTTAGTGSEVTPWAVLTEQQARRKLSVGGADLMPSVALVDPDLTCTMPPHLTAATGLDALSHCIEAYVSTRENPALDPMIRYGISLIGHSLRQAVWDGDDLDARQDVALAAMIGGIAISSNWLGACHSLAHPLSSLAGLHHGVAIAVMLPHQMRFSLDDAIVRYGHIWESIVENEIIALPARERAENAARSVSRLIRDINLPTSLQDLDVPASLIPNLAHQAYLDLNWQTNPRRVTEADLERLYRQAY